LLTDWLAVVNSQLVGMEEPARNIFFAVNSGINVVLYGPPGQAKTALMELAGRFFYPESNYIIPGGPGVTVSQLLGGYIPEEIKEYKFVFDLDKSPFNHSFVGLDEGLDMQTSVLLQLRSLITNQFSRIKNGMKENYCSPVEVYMLATNMDPNQFHTLGDEARVNSLQAIVDRFPIKIRVEMPPTLENYEKFLKMKGISDNTFLQIVMGAVKEGYVSPRTVGALGKYYTATGKDPNLLKGTDLDKGGSLPVRMEKITQNNKILEAMSAIRKDMSTIVPPYTIEHLKRLKKMREVLFATNTGDGPVYYERAALLSEISKKIDSIL